MSNKGQSLMELMIVVAVAMIVIGALTFATITSLRNAYFSKNQLQATKFAQEGIEKIRSIRDRDGTVITSFGTPTANFSALWNVKIIEACSPQPCNFVLDPLNNSLAQINNSSENLGESFQRFIQITDDVSTYQDKKTITVVVSWLDFSGTHQSKLTTYLRKL